MTNLVTNQLSPKTTPKLLRRLWLNAVSNRNRGVTLFEVVLASVVTGVIAAIGTPSLMGMIQGDQVKQGLDQIQLALQDAQKQAIQRSQKCTITVKSGKPPTLETSQDCLGGSERELPRSVAITSNFTNDEITFSFKGSTRTMGTIVVKPAQGKGEKRCLVMGLGLGIMRSGIYDPTQNDSNPKAEHCYKSHEALKNK